MSKMKIEIWSDVMCPFCYIGKRKLEQSLNNSPLKDDVEIEWKSYQLNPELVTDTSIGIDDYLAQHKGMSKEQARQLNQQVTEMAKEEGLVFNFDQSVVANSFLAHQLLHFAKQYNKQNEAEEILFKSYFTDGKNIDDIEFLKSIVNELGLNIASFENSIVEGTFVDEVKMDIHEARQIGVKGVPFFVYDRKYAISGAQPLALFDQTLNQAFEQWKGSTSITLQNSDGPSCGPEGC